MCRSTRCLRSDPGGRSAGREPIVIENFYEELKAKLGN